MASLTSAAAPPSSCEIARITEDLLAASIARTTPRDACRAAAVSPAFRAAADSDAVWAGFLPADLPPLADGELSPAPTSKKALFMRLTDSNSPVLLADRLTSMWLDRDTGAKCYMLSARALDIVWGEAPQYWQWIPLADSRFSEGAELLAVCWLAIHGKIHCKMLSRQLMPRTWCSRYPMNPMGWIIHPRRLQLPLGKANSLVRFASSAMRMRTRVKRCLRITVLMAGWRWKWVSSTMKKVKMVRCPLEERSYCAGY